METQEEKKRGLGVLDDETLGAIVEEGMKNGTVSDEALSAFNELARRDRDEY